MCKSASHFYNIHFICLLTFTLSFAVKVDVSYVMYVSDVTLTSISYIT